jgi:AAA domain
VAPLIRRTHNTKRGDPIACRTLWNGGGAVDQADIVAMLDLLQDAPLLTRKGHGTSYTNGHGAGWKAPVDVEARLARMRWQGGGDTAINITQRDCSAKMLREDCSVDVVVDYILEATQKAVAGELAANDWDWDEEKVQIEGMCYRHINKNHELSHLLPDHLRTRFEALTRAGRTPCVHRPFGRAWCVRAQHEYTNGGDDTPKTKDACGEAGKAEPRRHRFPLLRFKDLRPGMGEQNWLVEELIPKEGLVVLWGKYKSLKSFLMLTVSFHVAKGWEYRDRAVTQGLVVYCAFEGAHGYAKRAEALRLHYGLAADDDPPLRLMAAHVNLIKDHALFIAEIRSQLDDGETPVAIVLDTLNRSLRGSEGKDVDMAAYIEAATAIKDAFKCVVMIVHHCGWDETRMRGHSSLPGAIDAELSARREGDIVTLKVECMRDGPEDVEIVSTFKKVVVSQDASGKDVDSLVIVPADGQRPAGQRKYWPRALAKFHDALVAALREYGEPHFLPGPGERTVRAVDLEEVRQRFYQTYVVDGETEAKRQEARRKAFGRSVERAQREKLVDVLVDEKACTTKIWFAPGEHDGGE